jgi:hypothetical protein
MLRNVLPREYKILSQAANLLPLDFVRTHCLVCFVVVCQILCTSCMSHTTSTLLLELVIFYLYTCQKPRLLLFGMFLSALILALLLPHNNVMASGVLFHKGRRHHVCCNSSCVLVLPCTMQWLSWLAVTMQHLSTPIDLSIAVTMYNAVMAKDYIKNPNRMLSSFIHLL